MQTINFKGFEIAVLSLEAFLAKMEDGDVLEVMKMDGYTFLYSSREAMFFALSEPKEVSNG